MKDSYFVPAGLTLRTMNRHLAAMLYLSRSMTDLVRSSFFIALMFSSGTWVVAQSGYSPCSPLPIDTTTCVVVDNTNAPGSGLDPGCAGFEGHDIWYAMIVPESGTIVVNTAEIGGLDDSALAIWTGTSCTSMNPVGCDDDGGEGYHANLFVPSLTSGDSVWIQAFGYGSGTGSFHLCVATPQLVELESSELPIVEINTLGQVITNGPKIDALMEITYNGAEYLTFVSDPPNIYSGSIGIEVRGASSAGYLQRPYGLETRDSLGENMNVSLLNMPEENDWVLLSNFNDRSLIKNQLSFRISQEMGQYAPRTHLCEVLLNDQYQGIYVFGEKIKRDAGRVDIATLTEFENSGDDLTGGYIIGQNLFNSSNSFESNYSPIDHPELDIHFVYEYPDADLITIEQKTYIAGFVDSLETALYASDFDDHETGYRKYMDVKSFIDYFLVNEVARNGDGFKKSVFFHKDKNSNGSKLKAGPVWDFDWAWKNIYECDIVSQIDGSGWTHQVNNCPTDNNSCGWYIRLLEDEAFRNELHCTYTNYRTTMLDTAFMFQYIDSIVGRVENAQARHFQTWPILGISGPAPDIGPVPTTYADEITAFKAWITLRLDWLDLNMPGLCQTVGSGAISERDPLTIFPNPSTGRVTIQGSLHGGSAGQLHMYDVTGRSVSTIPIATGTVSMEHQMPGTGTYYFKLYENSALVQTGKLVVL